MKIKIFACPECRARKFESLLALNVHLAKQHPSLRYKIVMIKNKPYTKSKERSTYTYIMPKQARRS